MNSNAHIKYAVCTNETDKKLFEHQLLSQAKRDDSYSKISAFLLHKNMHPTLLIAMMILSSFFGLDQDFLGIPLRYYFFLMLGIVVFITFYPNWIDHKIKQHYQSEIDQFTYFLTTGVIKNIIAHNPKEHLIEFEIEYLNQKSQISSRVFKVVYQTDIYDPNDFNDRENHLNALIDQPVQLYLSAESETLIQLYLINSIESAVHFKLDHKKTWWYFHKAALLSPVFLHPNDLQKIYLHYSKQTQHWTFRFQGECLEDITLHHPILNIREFELALSYQLADFDHVQYQSIKASHSEEPQLIWENKIPLKYDQKKALRKKLALQLSIVATVFSLCVVTFILSTKPFQILDDLLFHVLLSIMSILIITLPFIYLFYALCRRRHYLSIDSQVALFQIQPRKKGH